MELETAKQIMTVGLMQCSCLSKTVADADRWMTRSDGLKAYRHAVGQVLAWFLFEVFTPIGEVFAELRNCPFEKADRAPDFVPGNSLQSTLERIRHTVDDIERFANRLHVEGFVKKLALTELLQWTVECRRSAGVGRTA